MAFRKGESGNPKGRPMGKTMGGRLREAVGDNYDRILQAVINKAADGDMHAASLLLNRVAPTVKPAMEAVKVRARGKTLTDKAGSILGAAMGGELPADHAKALLEGLACLAKISEIDELAKRVEALENERKP